ncbi:hypothetical protein ACHAPJ_003742 [Fusarium lateritium]
MNYDNSVRLATASPCTQATTAETISLLSTIAHRAAEKAVDLILLPEGFIGGYPLGNSFGSYVGGRSDLGREEFATYFQSAVDLGDTVGNGAGAGDQWLRRQLDVPEGQKQRGDGTREELEEIARKSGVFIVTGCIERAGGSLYCAVVYVCPRLGVIGKRRKVMPTGAERLIWAQGSAKTLRAVTTTLRGVRVNLAAAICWENHMPLLRQSLYAQNINLYLAPTAEDWDVWLSAMRHVAVEGRCFVVSSNMCSKATDKSGTVWASRGGSSIVNPFGDVLAGPQWDDSDGLIFADVDFKDCIKGRLDIDTAGSYSRNDSFNLTVEGLNMDPLPY